MSLAAIRVPVSRQLTAAGLFIVSAVLGILAGYDPKLAIAAAVGIAFVLIAVADLAVGVAIFAMLTFLELAPVAGGLFSLAKFAGLTIAISWLAAVASERSQSRLFFAQLPLLTAILGFLVGWTALSGLWAEDPGESLDSLTRYVLNVALFPIVFTAVSQPRHLRWIGGGIVGGAAFAAAYGLINVPDATGAVNSVTAAGDLNRITGTVGDPNVLASVLVVGLVMALALALDTARSLAMRFTFGAASLICLAAIFATVSRGGVIALAAALIASVALGGRRRGRMAVVASLIIAASLAYFAFFASSAQVERLVDRDGGSGRTDIWKVGWRMVEDEPLHGIGAGNFPVSSIHYLLVAPGSIERSEFIVDQPAVAHNLYLEVLAELGVVGLALFLAVAGVSLVTAVRAAGLFDDCGEDGLSLIARAVAVGLISTLAADIFLSDEYSKLLWLLMALGPAMLALARTLDAKGRLKAPEARADAAA